MSNMDKSLADIAIETYDNSSASRHTQKMAEVAEAIKAEVLARELSVTELDDDEVLALAADSEVEEISRKYGILHSATLIHVGLPEDMDPDAAILSAVNTAYALLDKIEAIEDKLR